MSNFFVSKVHEIVFFLARTGERQFVASHEIQKKYYLRFHKMSRDDWKAKVLCLWGKNFI